MNEQDITNAVKAVLGQMKESGSHHEKGHVCRCHKHKMTLKAANALIEKVTAKAASMGVRPGGQACCGSEYGWGLHSKL